MECGILIPIDAPYRTFQVGGILDNKRLLSRNYKSISERQFLSQTKEFPPIQKIPLTGNQSLQTDIFLISGF